MLLWLDVIMSCGRYAWMAMIASRKMKRRMNMLSSPAFPVDVFASLVSSLTFAAVSHPQKKNTGRAAPVATPPMPPSEPGLNQSLDKLFDLEWLPELVLTSAGTAGPRPPTL